MSSPDPYQEQSKAGLARSGLGRLAFVRPSTFALASAVVAVVAAVGSSLVLFACASDSSAGTDDAGASDDAAVDAKKAPADAGTTADADAGASLCAISEAYYVACKQDLNCGAKYAAWCALNDTAINSAAYREAELACLTTSNCDADRRADCEYKSLAAATPTAAQTALVTAYCQTCEPSDVSGCKTRSTSYDAVAGPPSVTDIFVGAWEFGDAVTSEMTSSCTGAALDAGTDAGDGGCAKAFAGCTADVYLAHLPDCPP
jgi:hypothetical protein